MDCRGLEGTGLHRVLKPCCCLSGRSYFLYMPCVMTENGLEICYWWTTSLAATSSAS
jgi:hypothetical protein